MQRRTHSRSSTSEGGGRDEKKNAHFGVGRGYASFPVLECVCSSICLSVAPPLRPSSSPPSVPFAKFSVHLLKPINAVACASFTPLRPTLNKKAHSVDQLVLPSRTSLTPPSRPIRSWIHAPHGLKTRQRRSYRQDEGTPRVPMCVRVCVHARGGGEQEQQQRVSCACFLLFFTCGCLSLTLFSPVVLLSSTCPPPPSPIKK